MALPISGQDWTPSKIVAITEYPPLPRAARIYGTVEVKCTLDSSGAVTVAEALSGPKLLMEPARQNALQWKFERVSKKTSGNSAILRYAFLLEGEPQDRTKTTFVFELPDRIQIVAPPVFVDH
jgi:TonB family protein